MSRNDDRSPDEIEEDRVAKAKKDGLDKLEREEDIRWLMSNVRGRRIMNRLLDFTGVYRTSFTGNSETFFREGGRNVGLHFLADVQALSKEDYMRMLNECAPVKPNNASSGRTQ